DALAALYVIAVIDIDARAIGNAVYRPLLAALVEDDDRHVATHHDEVPLRVADHVAVADLHLALVGGLEERLVRHLCSTTHVEGTHRELRAGLADRLRRDHADGLADVDRRAAGQIAPVADGAHARLDLTGQCGADADRLNAGLLDRLDVALVDQASARDDHLARNRVGDVLERGAAEDALAERGHDLAGVDDRGHGQTLLGAAVGHGDDAVLRNVDQTAGQIARVRRLERGVGQALAGAVGGVEVLHHGQAFLEVRDDRRLDDRAVWAGHQAAHAGKLTHLGGRAART